MSLLLPAVLWVHLSSSVLLAGASFMLLLAGRSDRRTARGQPSRLFTWIGIVIILYMVVVTVLGYMASATT